LQSIWNFGFKIQKAINKVNCGLRGFAILANGQVLGSESGREGSIFFNKLKNGKSILKFKKQLTWLTAS